MLELLLPIDFINLIETLRFLFLHAEHSTLDYFFFNLWLARSTSKMKLTMEMFYPALASEPLLNWLNDFSDVSTQVHIVCAVVIKTCECGCELEKAARARQP